MTARAKPNVTKTDFRGDRGHSCSLTVQGEILAAHLLSRPFFFLINCTMADWVSFCRCLAGFKRHPLPSSLSLWGAPLWHFTPFATLKAACHTPAEQRQRRSHSSSNCVSRVIRPILLWSGALVPCSPTSTDALQNQIMPECRSLTVRSTQFSIRASHWHSVSLILIHRMEKK